MSFKKRHDVTIYSSDNSVMCDLTKAYFKNADIDFDEINISKSEENKKAMLEASSGVDRTPIVEFDGRIIVGYQPDIYDILTKD
jgi:arsenate reductase-like glutaredoxin family protein